MFAEIILNAAKLEAANNAWSILLGDIDSEQTSFNIADISLFPPPPFMISVGTEIMEVLSVNIGTKTFYDVIRGSEDTGAIAHPIGTRVENRWTAGTYYRLFNAIRIISGYYCFDKKVPIRLVKNTDSRLHKVISPIYEIELFYLSNGQLGRVLGTCDNGYILDIELIYQDCILQEVIPTETYPEFDI